MLPSEPLRSWEIVVIQTTSSEPTHARRSFLRDREFCNLSEVVVRKDDTVETLKNKVRLAAILGTWQASLADFRYLSSEWRKNCQEEALLGVSLTGILG
jgi:ribonucleoside-diphosphate reductase alpha chain